MISTLLGKPPNADVRRKAMHAGGLDVTLCYHGGTYWIAELPVTACVTFTFRKKGAAQSSVRNVPVTGQSVYKTLPSLASLWGGPSRR